MPLSMPSRKIAGLVTNRSSPTSCTFLPSRSVSSFQPSQSSSAMPSSIVTIGYFAHQPAKNSTNCSDGQALALALEVVLAVLVELRARRVEAEPDVARRPCSRPCRSPRGSSRSLPRSTCRSGAKPPSSPTAVAQAARLQHALQRVEDLDARAQRFGEARQADRQDHEFLQVDVVVGMRAAVDDVHHRHRQRAPRGCRRGSFHSGTLLRCRDARARSRAKRRAARSRRACPCSACRRARSASRRGRPGRPRRNPCSASAIVAVDVGDRLRARPCRDSASCRRRAARPLRASRSMRRSAPPRGRTRRRRG